MSSFIFYHNLIELHEPLKAENIHGLEAEEEYGRKVSQRHSSLEKGSMLAGSEMQQTRVRTERSLQQVKMAPSWSSVQPLSCVRLFATPWTEAHQASLSIINSQSLLKLMSIESVMPSNHLILCCPLLLMPPVRKLGPQYYNHKELNPEKSLNELGRSSSRQESNWQHFDSSIL